jgi:hypothetical protein
MENHMKHFRIEPLNSPSDFSLSDLKAELQSRFDCDPDELPEVVAGLPDPMSVLRPIHEHRKDCRAQQAELMAKIEARPGQQPLRSEERRWDAIERHFQEAGAFLNAALDHRDRINAEQASLEAQRKPFNTIIGGSNMDDQTIPGESLERGHSPLLVSDANLRGHVDAIQDGRTFGAIETHTLITVAGDYGSPGTWGAGGIREPVTLRSFAGIPVGELTGATAQMPSLTLPAGSAGVAEGTAHGEFTASDVVNLTTLRYGRWSEVTSFLNQFTSISSLNGAHAVAIARDLNLLDITAIQTAAGSVTAFDASNLDRNVRQAILKVAAATLVPPSEVVLFGTSAALGVVTGYAPANGDDRGSVTSRVYGARVYVTEAATAGNVYAFAPNGFKIFADRLSSASGIDATNGSNKFGQWIHSTAPGVFVVGSAAGVDVVTP